MVAKLNTKVRRGGTVLIAILGFFLVFFSSNLTKDSKGISVGAVAHADTPSCSGCVGGCACAGCCGSCGDGSSSDCGGGDGGDN
ncbi:hypothetical protein K2Q00_03740 [Patescibacteria group bacterium]|nr:hypothetical protein [Patescibacteria group bacterium]